MTAKRLLREIYLTAIELSMVQVVGAFMVNDWFIVVLHAAMMAILWLALVVFDMTETEDSE